MTAVRRQLGDVDGLVRRGAFSPVLDWLRTHVHLRGRMLESDALVEAATGEPPSERPLVESLWERYGPAHGLPSRPA
jgi:carboxypeptidase Taq